MENAQKLVEALRSGLYQQGRKHLCKGGLYCCLGVACELYAAEHPEFKIEIGYDYGTEVRRYGGGIHGLPECVRSWLGFRGNYGEFEDKSLATENDRGVSFNEIADLIESRPEGLFA